MNVQQMKDEIAKLEVAAKAAKEARSEQEKIHREANKRIAELNAQLVQLLSAKK